MVWVLGSFGIWDLGFGTSAAPAAIRVYAKVNAETSIYPGDDFSYSIVVEGGGKPSKVDLTPLAPFHPRRAGSGTSMQTINDRTTVTYSDNYVITAGPTGKMTLPAVTVVVDGQTYTTNPVEVTISRPGTTDRLSLELALSETRCYVGQPVVMTVTWTVTARVDAASFSVPVFKSDDFYIEDVSDPEGSYAREQASIDGVPVVVSENRRLVQGMEAAILSFRKVLIPKRAGRIRLDPLTVSTNMAVGRVRTDDFFNPYRIKYERVSVPSNAVELEVLPLPPEGKPPEFYGLVGRYTIEASAAPTKMSVGDPITLTVRIGGNPYLKPVQWPQLEQVADLAAGFKIPAEKASPVIEDGTGSGGPIKVFTQTIRANSDAVKQVPPIPLAYFDPQEGRYVVARTEPIPLEVAPTKILTNADVEGAGSAPANREVEAIRKGLSANYYGPEVLVDQQFSLLSAALSPGYAAVWSVPLAALMVSSVLRLAGRSSPESAARKRRRRAGAAATARLRTVPAAEPALRPEMLATALKGYIGDRFDRIAASLTADDCRQAVVEATGDSTLAARCHDLIAACEAARYAPLNAQVEASHVQEATELIHAIERQLKK